MRRLVVTAVAAAFAVSALADVVVVRPDDMHGWSFFTETGTGSGAMEFGPAAPPMGAGSARITVDDVTSGGGIGLAAYQGLRLADITALSYSTYTNSSAGGVRDIALQFNVDYDLTDSDTSWQGRLVFEPYNTPSNTVADGTWQTWDPTAGRWWATGGPGAAIFGISSPMAWSDIISLFPNIGIHQVFGAVLLKAGSGWTGGFTGWVDAFTIATATDSDTWNFEPIPSPASGLLGLIGLITLRAVRRQGV